MSLAEDRERLREYIRCAKISICGISPTESRMERILNALDEAEKVLEWYAENHGAVCTRCPEKHFLDDHGYKAREFLNSLRSRERLRGDEK